MDVTTTTTYSELPALLLHAGYMSGAEYPHLRYERERLIREQRERDMQAASEQRAEWHALGLR